MRVPRRAAPPARHRGARPRPPRVPDHPGRPDPVDAVRGRLVAVPVARRRAHRGGGRGALAVGRRGVPRLRGPATTASARRSGAARPATRGSATRPTGPRSRSCSPTTPRGSRSCSRRRSPTSSSATSRTSASARRCTGRASSARSPGPATRAPPGSTRTTASASSGGGRSSRAGWAGSRSASPTPPTDAGAVVAAGVPVAAIVPGEGVRLEGGETIRAPVVVSNADPVRTVGLLEDVPAALQERVDGWRITSPVIKLNLALSRLPTFTGVRRRPDDLPGPGRDRPQHRRHPGRLRDRPAAASRPPSGASCTSRRRTTRPSPRRGRTR